MIYCVRFSEVVRALEDQGFHEAGHTAENVLFRRGTELITIHGPNDHGDVPEILVNDAFDNADLPVPRWDVFWCD